MSAKAKHNDCSPEPNGDLARRGPSQLVLLPLAGERISDKLRWRAMDHNRLAIPMGGAFWAESAVLDRPRKAPGMGKPHRTARGTMDPDHGAATVRTLAHDFPVLPIDPRVKGFLPGRATAVTDESVAAAPSCECALADLATHRGTADEPLLVADGTNHQHGRTRQGEGDRLCGPARPPPRVGPAQTRVRALAKPVSHGLSQFKSVAAATRTGNFDP